MKRAGPLEPETVTVALGQRSYDILAGAGLIARAGTLIRPLARRGRAAIVTDDIVAGLHGGALSAALAGAGIDAPTLSVPAGEDSKSFAELARLCDVLLALELERGDLIIAFGGGVVGDLTGFAAGILKRGIDFIQIPTTLLAQVDSSVGGKTAINARYGKNLIGLFHQPRLVIADTGVLDTLPRRQLLAGYAEIVKYGLIGDHAFYEWLEANGRALIDGDARLRQTAILKSCRAKVETIAQDERETTGARALLNFGHTFGHALEAATGFSDRLLHGEAVAIGMVLALRLSEALKFAPSGAAARAAAHLSGLGLRTSPREIAHLKASPQALMGHMAHDKKAESGRIALVLSRGIGQAFLTRDVDPTQIEAIWTEALNEP